MKRVTLIETNDRREGVEASLKALGVNPVKNKDVLIKPNFNRVQFFLSPSLFC